MKTPSSSENRDSWEIFETAVQTVLNLALPNLVLRSTTSAVQPYRYYSRTIVQAYQDMSLRVVTSTGAPTFQLFSVLFKFSIGLIFLVLVKFNY
eukprot:SAG31_NODE_33111_length_347_cov_1.907258_1_plen_93_part_01